MNDLTNTLDQLASVGGSTLDSLGDQCRHVSFESNDKQFVDSIKAKLGTFLGNMAAAFAGIKLRFTDRDAFRAWDKVEQVKKMDYQATRSLAIKVPAGFKGNLKEYLHTIEKDVSALEGLDQALGKVSTEIAQFISHPEKLTAQSAGTNFQGLVLLTRDDLDRVQDYFKAGTKTDARYGDVFHNMAEFEQAIKQYEELRKRVMKVDFESINKRIARIADLTSALSNQLQDSPTTSGAASTALANVLDGLAVTTTIGVVVADSISAIGNAVAESAEVLAA